MSTKFVEGFDHVSSVGLLGAKGWTITLPGGGGTAGITTGRTGGQALYLDTNSTGANIPGASKSLPAAYTSVVIGFGVWVSARPNQTTEFLCLRAGSTLTIRLAQDVNGHIVVLNSGGSGFTCPSVLNLSTWYYVEVKAVIAGGSGTIELHLNGATELASSTLNMGSTGVDNVLMTCGSPPPGFGISHIAGQYRFDDMYLLDAASGSAPWNTFLGDVVVETLYPTSDGGHTDWAPDSGSAHFSRVNEHTSGTYPDGDTSYVADSTVGHRDSYGCSDLSVLAGTVFAVQSNLYARKDAAGGRQLAAVARVGGTDYDGASVVLGTSYAYLSEIRETNPATSAQWTIAGVNAAEFGVKVAA